MKYRFDSYIGNNLKLKTMTTFNSMIVFDFANRVTNYDRDSKIVAIEKDLIDKGFVYPTEWDTLYPIQKWSVLWTAVWSPSGSNQQSRMEGTKT